ncbi:MAG: hypothetical protein PHC75_00710 [Burkholderiales bacterium]|nr:hypothetical protein [Burkholderiales bacterium]
MLNKLIILLLFFICPLSYADLGQIHIKSYLQQKLLAKIEVNDISDNDIPTISIASLDEFRNLGVDYYSDIGLLRCELIKSNNGRYVLNITSLKPIDSSILNILLHYQVGTNDMYKQYTILLEPISLKNG